MNERKQDERPVYMGTFSKYMKTVESRLSLLESENERQKRNSKNHYQELHKIKKFIVLSLCVAAALAIVMTIILY